MIPTLESKFIHSRTYITTKIYFVDKSAPATQAFIDVVITPARNALNTTSDISFPRDGAIALNPATWIPMELGFAKPHKAKEIILY